MLGRINLIRINDRVLAAARSLLPAELRSLDAIHLATAQLPRDDLTKICTYDERMASAAESMGWSVVSPD